MAIKNVKVKNGLFLEFGVYKGSSLNFIAKKINNETIYGFDSFEGLPTFWMDGFGIGTFKTDYQKLKFRSNVKIVKGLFQETLPKFKVEHTQPISFVHIDSDLYESAKFVLTSLKDQIVSGTVIVFDDFFNYSGWQDGEFRAFKEFLDITKINFRYTIYCYKGDNVAVEII
ncbi:MAG: class I SAM-dependent methyltransferase [Thermoplasmatales archaeon]|jgi:hypothetical protein|nr:class I SAM-dependent methyltransferase [Candidatus Thermoplasmatota archaeon]MCL6002386.1 class I SAM-dependent methyltransferase [Candidatus Thermoplasmatota archaeon]MDA8054504.1 class I SAM-dependent methyltransferase [Thermoplasmatales archaeon]